MRKIITIMLLLALAGCGERPSTNLGANSIKADVDGYDATVRIVTTTDGTRCAIMVGYQRGGITCDWEASRK